MDQTGNGGAADFRPIMPWIGLGNDHLHQAIGTAYNPEAPEDEVMDAGSYLAKAYAPAADAIDPGVTTMMRQFSQLQLCERSAENLVAKAIHARDTGEKIKDGKAETSSWGSEFGRGYFKWLPKRGVGMPILRAFARRLEVAQAIIRTRKRQIERFSRPSRAIDQLGWRIVMTNEDAMPGAGLKEEIQWLTRVLECGGREFSPVRRRELRRQGLVQFLRNLTEDGLVLDNAAVELVGLDGANGLDSWYVRPSETFMLASPDFKEVLPDGRRVFAFQVLNGRAEIPFAYDELAIWIRNASTWAEENGYGYSEFEQSLDTLNNIIQAITYTKQGLSENAVPRGILMAYGNYDLKTQNAFKQAWAAKVRGIQNQFGVPVLFSRGQQGGVQYLNTGQPFDEMAFSKWIALNVTVMGAIFGVAPEEIGFEGFTAEKSTLSGDDTGEKLAAAKDKGLYPLLKDAASFISDEILSRFNDSLRLEFTGLDAQNSDERWKEKIKHMTINEVRALFDLPQHPIAWIGDLPADPGEQSAEFQRIQQGATYGEMRKLVGLPEYPSPMLSDAPVNPSLGALYSQVLAGNPDSAYGEGEDPQDTQSEDQDSEVSQRLKELSGDSNHWETLNDYKARAQKGEEVGTPA